MAQLKNCLLTEKPGGLKFHPHQPYRKPGAVVHTQNPCTVEAKVGYLWGLLASLFSLISELLV